MNQSAEMVKIAAKALEDKKAEDIRPDRGTSDCVHGVLK